MLLHSLAVLHKSRKQLLLPSVLGHWVASALSGSGCIWSATQHPPHPPAVAPAVPPDLNCMCLLTHPALLSTSLGTKADITSASFSSFPSSWLWDSSLRHYLRFQCRSVKGRNEGGLHSKRAISFPWKVCTVLTPGVCFLLQTNNFHDTWYKYLVSTSSPSTFGLHSNIK